MIGKIAAFGIKLVSTQLEDGFVALRPERRDALAVGMVERAEAAAGSIFGKSKPGLGQLRERPQFDSGNADPRPDGDVGIAGFGDLDLNAALDHRKIDELGTTLPSRKANAPNELDGF